MNNKYLEALFQCKASVVNPNKKSIVTLLNILGGLQNREHVIHIAGTNGKGSTLAILESLLLAHNESVFLTTSPHLLKYNERFRYNQQDIRDNLLYEGLEIIRYILGDTAIDATFQGHRLRCSFFEISIALAFWLAKKTQAKWLLLETGVGGRWDATNIVKQPCLTMISSISYDHQSYLGNTLESISVEKLAIHRQGTPLLIGKQNPSLDAFLDRYIQIHNLQAYRAKKDFWLDSTTWHFYFPKYNINDLEVCSTNLNGAKQIENLELALAGYSILYTSHNFLPKQQLHSALQNVIWQGRLEYIQDNLLLDGAHNPSGMQALLEHLKMFHMKHNILFATSWLSRKQIWSQKYDWDKLQITFAPLLLESNEGVSQDEIIQTLQTLPFPLQPVQTVISFAKKWQEKKYEEYDLLVIAGSLYLLGEWKKTILYNSPSTK